MDLTLDLIALAIFIICILLYGLMLGYSLRNPAKTRKGLLNLIYEHYVDVRSKESPIVAVQAARNLIMANSVFISALLVLLGILFAFYSLIFSEDILPGTELNLGYVQMVVMVLIIVSVRAGCRAFHQNHQQYLLS